MWVIINWNGLIPAVCWLLLPLLQILLGPNAAVAGTGSQNLLPGMGMMPPGMVPPKWPSHHFTVHCHSTTRVSHGWSAVCLQIPLTVMLLAQVCFGLCHLLNVLCEPWKFGASVCVCQLTFWLCTYSCDICDVVEVFRWSLGYKHYVAFVENEKFMKF